jgi:hypothetical protein
MNGQKLKRGHLEVWKQSQMSICKNKHKLKNVNILNAINKPISSNCLTFWEKQTNSALKGGSIFWCTDIIRTFSSDNEPQKKKKYSKTSNAVWTFCLYTKKYCKTRWWTIELCLSPSTHPSTTKNTYFLYFLIIFFKCGNWLRFWDVKMIEIFFPLVKTLCLFLKCCCMID